MGKPRLDLAAGDAVGDTAEGVEASVSNGIEFDGVGGVGAARIAPEIGGASAMRAASDFLVERPI